MGMRIPACVRPSPRFARFCAIGLFGSLLAACGNDVTRFNDDPNGHPYRRGEVTNSTQPAPAPTAQIESRPLGAPSNVNGTPVYGPTVYGSNNPPPQNYSNPPQPGYPPQNYQPGYSSAPASVPAAPAPVSRAPIHNDQEPTGTVAVGGENWRWDGGTAVTLKPGETVEILSRRYHVPVVAIMRANNLADASLIQPGRRIVIPSRQHGQNVSASTAQPADRATVVHTVVPHETLLSIAKHYNVERAKIAYANNINEHVPLRVGQKLTIPGVAIAISNAPKSAANPPPATPHVETMASPQRRAEDQPPVDNVATVKPADPDPEPKPAAAGGLQFRWPVKGRVISNFGGKPNGQQNDGINISVPENTAVKASEDGVVAYAGNELKGYGNLVLIKHADGWVTAYAHNSEILVHRGETVKRGQVISKVGQSGGVPSPQLHFEIRKGSTPVDPAQHLSSL
jgi:murein DD-endopeptidase MepM/ murein hydrolase activator NlpD